MTWQAMQGTERLKPEEKQADSSFQVIVRLLEIATEMDRTVWPLISTMSGGEAFNLTKKPMNCEAWKCFAGYETWALQKINGIVKKYVIIFCLYRDALERVISQKSHSTHTSEVGK